MTTTRVPAHNPVHHTSVNYTPGTPVKASIELFRPAFGVLPKTGDADPVDQGKPG